MMIRRLAAIAGVMAALQGAAVAKAQTPDPAAGPATGYPAGTVLVPGFPLAFSAFASPEAREDLEFTQSLAALRRAAPSNASSPANGAPANPLYDRWIRTHDRFAVTMTEASIAGVGVQVFVPNQGVKPKNRNRVLINLHGGGFTSGWDTWSRTESIPIASVAGIKVISLNYSMAPAHRFPAASEDVAAVYRELLRTHRPSEIGIYGCSAGGIITGQSMAWFDHVGLPMPAAIGLFSSYITDVVGDSVFISGRIGGLLPAPPGVVIPSFRTEGYLAGTRSDDPLARPSASPELLARFPPTLLITGSRAFDVSPATRSQLDLVKAGVDARLYIWDGVDHCFTYNAATAESQEAYQITAAFFDAMMDRAAAAER